MGLEWGTHSSLNVKLRAVFHILVRLTLVSIFILDLDRKNIRKESLKLLNSRASEKKVGEVKEGKKKREKERDRNESGMSNICTLSQGEISINSESLNLINTLV